MSAPVSDDEMTPVSDADMTPVAPARQGALGAPEAPSVPGVFPADKTKEQDSAWSTAAKNNELNDQIDPAGITRAALGGFYPYAAHLAGVDPALYEEAIKHHPVANMVGQLAQQYGLSKLFPVAAGASLGQKAAGYGLQSAVGHLSNQTNVDPDSSISDNLPGTIAAGAMGAIGGPLVEKGVESVANGASWLADRVRGVPAVGNTIESASGAVDSGVSKMLDFLGIVGEERTAILKSPELQQEIFDNFVAKKPGVFTGRQAMKADSASRLKDATLARDTAASSIQGQMPNMSTEDVLNPIGKSLSDVSRPTGNPADADVLSTVFEKYSPKGGSPASAPAFDTAPGSSSYGQQVSPGAPASAPSFESVPTEDVMSNIHQVAGGVYGGPGTAAYGKGMNYSGTGAQAKALGAMNEGLDSAARKAQVSEQLMNEYRAGIGKARSARTFDQALSESSPTAHQTGGAFSAKQIPIREAARVFQGGVEGMRTGGAMTGIERAMSKIDQIAAAGGQDISGISKFDTAALRRQLAGIAAQPKSDWPALEYVLMATNPAYMAIKRKMDNE